MKKLLILCVSLLATTALLVGCGKGGDDSSSSVESNYSSTATQSESSMETPSESSIETEDTSSSETEDESSSESSGNTSSEEAPWEVDSSEKWTSNH